MQHRREYGRGSNDFGRNAESIFREHLQNDPRFGGGWAHDWDSNPNQQNSSYRGGPRRRHMSDDRDYSIREGHGSYAGENGSGSIYDGGNRGRADYGHSSAYGRRGYYDRGSYYEDAGRYSPRFHERREYDEYDRREELNGSRREELNGSRRDQMRDDDHNGYGRRDTDRQGRERDSYDPRNIGSNDRRDRWSSYSNDHDNRYSSNYRDDIGNEQWYQGNNRRDPREDGREDRHTHHHRHHKPREYRDHRGFTPGDPGGQFGGRNTW